MLRPRAVSVDEIFLVAGAAEDDGAGEDSVVGVKLPEFKMLLTSASVPPPKYGVDAVESLGPLPIPILANPLSTVLDNAPLTFGPTFNGDAMFLVRLERSDVFASTDTVNGFIPVSLAKYLTAATFAIDATPSPYCPLRAALNIAGLTPINAATRSPTRLTMA